MHQIARVTRNETGGAATMMANDMTKGTGAVPANLNAELAFGKALA
jgi:hypothetical protein